MKTSVGPIPKSTCPHSPTVGEARPWPQPVPTSAACSSVCDLRHEALALNTSSMCVCVSVSLFSLQTKHGPVVLRDRDSTLGLTHLDPCILSPLLNTRGVFFSFLLIVPRSLGGPLVHRRRSSGPAACWRRTVQGTLLLGQLMAEALRSSAWAKDRKPCTLPFLS